MNRIVRVAVIAVYLIVMVVAVFLLDDYGSNGPGFAILMGASVLLGLGTGNPWLMYLSFLAVPIAIPFGTPDDPASQAADPVLPVAVGAIYYAMFSSVLIVLAAFVRRKAEARLQRRRLHGSDVS